MGFSCGRAAVARAIVRSCEDANGNLRPETGETASRAVRVAFPGYQHMGRVCDGFGTHGAEPTNPQRQRRWQ